MFGFNVFCQTFFIYYINISKNLLEVLQLNKLIQNQEAFYELLTTKKGYYLPDLSSKAITQMEV